jgi:hypothetical protein
MQWYELAENPSVLQALYTDVPSLDPAYLTRIHLQEHEDRMSLWITLSRFPDRPPASWTPRGKQQFAPYLAANAISVQLVFSHVTMLQVTGWVVERAGHTTIESSPEGAISCHVITSHGQLDALAQRFHIAEIHGYYRKEDERVVSK